MRVKLLTALLFVLAASGAYAFFDRRDPPAAPVTQAPITRGDIVETVASTGTIDALRTVQVGSQVSGTVMELGADYNSIVRKDQVIARLDPSLIQVQVDIQQANVDRQHTEIGNQQVQLDNAELNLSRARALFAKQLVSQQDLDQAVLTASANRASVESARKQLVQAEANLNQAKLNLSYCTIRAPIDGVVIQRLVDTGQTVQSSMNTPQFFVLATSLDHLKLTADVDESDIGKIRSGQSVGFTVDAYRGQAFHGVVDSVRLNSVSTQNVVTYQTIVDVLNPDLRLRPGMTASLQIVVGSAHDVVRVPMTALRFRPTADIYAALGLTPPAQPARPASAAGTVRALSLANGAGRDWTPAREVTTKPPVTASRRPADKIDELFAPYHEAPTRGRVWIWDDVARRLDPIDVQLGVTDGQNSALLSGALKPGQSVVTGVLLPAPPVAVRPGPSPFMGPQRGGYRRF